MRATRETLLKLAQEHTSERANKDRQILAVYLCGSVLSDEHLLGGTTDIDLFFVHLDEPAVRREVRQLSDEAHLDIAHLSQVEFRQSRQLRVDPWMGPALNNSRVLYDPQHFMDYTIAGVRGQFDRPDHVHQRASQLVGSARRIWTGLREDQAKTGIGELLRYLRGVAHTANAIATLSGPPLTERRFLLSFPQRAAALGRPGLYPGLLGLLGAPSLEPSRLAGWITDWQAAFQALTTQVDSPLKPVPARLHPLRQSYYRRAFEFLLGSSQPENVLWPLLYTWTLAVNLLGEDSDFHANWQEAITLLNLAGIGFTERLAALNAYLGMVEEILADWARQNGVE